VALRLPALQNRAPSPGKSPLKFHFWHAYCFVKSQIQSFGLTCNLVAPPQFIGSTETVQADIFASEWCGALRKNKQ
jgi:hypothetical protein